MCIDSVDYTCYQFVHFEILDCVCNTISISHDMQCVYQLERMYKTLNGITFCY